MRALVRTSSGKVDEPGLARLFGVGDDARVGVGGEVEGVEVG
ncbi:hypothetical protein JOD64_002835 [Micromonospora luteifusca]|uniref:Uncharacterized protein n=1 Tax=Micromonospora luteifusca TaxID=709860 RepID=A0ABS2LTX0_9ACTN|nr:hypothetical protein [Micromonospora luteifusca]MBM7491613.1 hypothetical protein [Micromonospora luteifusca]